MEHRAWLRCPGEFLFGGERGSADVLAWRRAGVLVSRRPEGSEHADNPGRENDRSQQWRRHCRKSPRVHHPGLQRLHRNRIAQPSMRTPLIVRTRQWPRNGANGQVVCFSWKCCLCATAGGRPANARCDGRASTHMQATLPPEQAVVMRDLPSERTDNPRASWRGWWRRLFQNRDLTLDRRKRGETFRPGTAW